jgi:hypothetical protein
MDAALDFADQAASGSSRLRGSHLLRSIELNKGPDDLDRLDTIPRDRDVGISS